MNARNVCVVVGLKMATVILIGVAMSRLGLVLVLISALLSFGLVIVGVMRFDKRPRSWVLFAMAIGVAGFGLWLASRMTVHVADQMKASGQFCQLQHAIHNYHDAHGRLPGPIRDAQGRALLSWRESILPFVEEERLYRSFHLNEPWDSPHNLALMRQMPSTFRSPTVKDRNTTSTSYLLVTGTGTANERDGMTFADISDRLEDTILVIEASESVPWTKPEEWECLPDKPLPPRGQAFTSRWWITRRMGFSDDVLIMRANGCGNSFLPRDTPDAELRRLVTRSGRD